MIMNRSLTGVLLMNVGTPDSPRTADVRRYLRQFLGDGRVIDLGWFGRKLLVHGIIAPFRAPKSAKAYRKLWTPKGSPLIIHGNALREAVAEQLGPGYRVALAMSYQNPSIHDALLSFRKAGVQQLVLMPLYPQYASSSTGAALQAAFQEMSIWNDIPGVRTVPPFYREEGYLAAFAGNIRACAPERFDHVLFSFHGLPERHIRRSHTVAASMLQKELNGSTIAGCACEREDMDLHPSCYKMQCHWTARELARRCGLPVGGWSTGFQSRLDSRWVKPFSDERIKELAQAGAKRLLVVSPAFVADCLETVVEIGEEYAELFREHGGEELRLVPSLNETPAWANAVADLVRRGR
jgi:protoporphyrin/coproporphyrin ferrochelatase